LNIEDIFNIPDAVIYDPDKLKSIEHVSIDSRQIGKNTLFIAIKGERFDGHDFIRSAIRNGAKAVMINKNVLKNFDDIKVPIVTVKNTTDALGDTARIWRGKLKAKVIGITGSSGKTTIKNMLTEIISEKYSVNKTEANNNNHIGVPLTILNTNTNHQVLVAELGTNHFGEIPYTAEILSPDYALITNIGDSHLEYLKNRNGVWKEKSSLFNSTIENGGKVFLNYDDPIIKAKHSKKGRQVSYGFNGKVDVKGKIIFFNDDGLPVIDIINNKKNSSFNLPVHGEQTAKNFLACCAIAFELGFSAEQIRKSLKKMKATPGRLSVQKFKNFILIDDTYNANPDSTQAAIRLVKRIKTFDRKILFLGDMLELGQKSIMLHKQLEKVINESEINEVYLIGPKMLHLSKQLVKKNIVVKHFPNRTSLLNQIKKMSFDKSVILVKGSRGMKMEEFLSEIKLKSMN